MSNKLYNEEIKERFLSTYDNEATKTTIRNVFAKTYIIENTLEIDMYDMNLPQLGKCIENTVPFSKNVAMSTGRFISQYITWAIENGYRESNINPLKGTDDQFYDQYIDKTRKVHYSKNEFIELLESLDNAQDQSFLSLIWSGLMGERFSELIQLKFTDIDFENKTVYIAERDETIQVEDFVIRYLEKGRNQKTYYQYNMKTKETTEKELLESHYVFKNVRSPRSQIEGQMIGMSVLYNRLHAIKEITGIEHLTPNSIRQSGIIYACVQLFLRDRILAYEQFAEVGKVFKWSMIENNGYRYYNTYLLREFVTVENISDLYGIQVEFAKK